MAVIYKILRKITVIQVTWKGNLIIVRNYPVNTDRYNPENEVSFLR